MKYPDSLVIGATTRVLLPSAGVYSDAGPDLWFINVDGIYYGPNEPVGTGGYNVSFVQDVEPYVVAAVYVPNTASSNSIITPILVHSPPGSTVRYLFERPFKAQCFVLLVNISSLSSDPVPNTDPQQYVHHYLVNAQCIGGTPPYTYSWNGGSTGGTVDFVDPSSAGDSCIMEVTNTTPTFSPSNGTVFCLATDSSSPPCTSEGSASIGDPSNPTIQCIPSSPNGSQCSCTANMCPSPLSSCQQTSGNNPVGSSNPNNFTGNMGGSPRSPHGGGTPPNLAGSIAF